MKQHTLLLYDTLPFNLQKGAAASQEETLPGSAPRQDWKSDFKPGAHGTFFKDCTILCQVTEPQLMRFNVIYIIKSILGKNKTSESYTLKLKRFYCSVWLFEFSLVSTVTGVEFLHTTQQTTTSVSCERRLFFILRIYLQLGCWCLFSSVFFFDVLILVNRFKISNSCKLRWKSSRGSKLATTVWRACTRSGSLSCFMSCLSVFRNVPPAFMW